MATAGGNNLGPPPIISLSSPLHHHHPQSPLGTPLVHPTSPSSSSGPLPISGHGLRESQAPNPGDLSGIFSVVLNRQQHQQNHHHPLTQHHVRWPSFSMGSRSLWTKYCLLCTLCGSAATILAAIFLVVASLFRYYTTSIYYFETVPTYIPAILLSICGVSTIAFSCKRNRNIILLRITACWSLCSAALSSVITITTSLIHMNRLQTLKECVYTKNPPACTCYSHSFGMQGPAGPETTHYLFENTPDCDVIHGILYSCLRAVFAISVVAVLLSIFLCMLLYQLIGHERKKAYWSRIRRINSDWSADFIACLARPMPRERSSLLPLMPSLMNPATGTMPLHGPSILPPPGWGPPPSYDESCGTDTDRPSRHLSSQRPGLCSIQPTHSFAGTSSGGFTGGGFFNNRSSASFAFHGGHHPPPRRLRLVTSHSENSFRNVANNPDGLMYPHPFSPTITSVDPVSIFKQHSYINQHNHHNNHHHRSRNNPSAQAISACNIGHNDYQYQVDGEISPPNGNPTRTFRSLSTQVLQRTMEDDECCMGHSYHGTQNMHHHSSQLPQSSSFHTNPSGRNSEFSITSLSMPDNSSMSITMKSSNEIPFNDSNCCNINHETSNSLAEDDDFALNNNQLEETGLSDQELSLTSNCTTSEVARGVQGIASSSSTGAVGKKSGSHGAPTTSSEPKIINANKNSFTTGQDSSVINSDTDIILNKKSLEFWGSLKKHKNFQYYGGSGNSTSRRRRKDKSKSSLSKISSLPCSPFMNMRRKLFGPGGKSLECVQNLNYNFSYSMAPIEPDSLVFSTKGNNAKSDELRTETEESFKEKRKGSSDSSKSGYASEPIVGRHSKRRMFSREDESNTSAERNCSVAEIRPELT